ncbi:MULTISPECIES: cytochrome-c peroxidase [unclassified Pseudomonas]|uniref:cytochrome-c peroxidase n=1 Tax=unclassified Pseudomonas TaxID=196821 RepID=UPI000CD22979|nr:MULTISPECIES: cytochrome c peroxidase [unclassified Pseudomonas]POA58231.1 cytochrome B6 [Pseudomonas sp. FW507-12TSA]
MPSECLPASRRYFAHVVLGLLLAWGSQLALAAPLDEPLKPLPPPPALDPQRVELGRRLFNDPRLSVDNSRSCASCHRLDLGGADAQHRSPGIKGQVTRVNAPSVFNAALNFRQFWDGRAETLEEQVDGVLQSPIEMGNNWESLLQTLEQDPQYRQAFAKLYPDALTAANVRNALVTYERTLLSGNSRFDQYLLGNTDILSLEEKYGYQRFKDYGCIACHQGVNIGGNMFQKFGVMGDYFAARGSPTEADLGRFLITGDEQDRNVFKVPSLRNVAITAPYFHDGSAQTLEQAVDVMFKYQLGRPPNPLDTSLIVKFLKTLTGEWDGKPL